MTWGIKAVRVVLVVGVLGALAMATSAGWVDMPFARWW